MTGYRLSIVAPSAYPLGGVQTWLDYLVPALECAGWAVTVHLVDGVHSNGQSYLEQHPFQRARLVANPTGSREGRVRALVDALASSQADLVLCVNIVDTYAAVSRLRERGAGPKVAMALHALGACFFDDIALYRNTLDAVIATNRLAAAAASAIGGIEDSRVFHAPCGIVVGHLPKEERNGGALDLLVAGRFDQVEKRILDVPRILAELERSRIHFRLRLAGSGPDESALREALSPFGDRVEFLGVLDPERMSREFYRPGSILLVTSPMETGPLVAWEAMAAGTLVVTSAFVGMHLEGALRPGRNCLAFPVGDVVGAAGAVASLRDESLRIRLAEAAFSQVRQRYELGVSVAAWNAALERTLDLPVRESAPSPEPPPSGRLDALLGVRTGESVRRLIGLSFEHSSAGAEWPHSYGRVDQAALVERLRELEATT